MLLERTGITPFLSRSFAFLLVILMACPLVLWLFERRANAEIQTVPNAYFWMWRTLMEQGSPLEFRTAGGWLVSYLVVIVGVGLVATGTATIVSRLVDLLLRRQSGMHETHVSEHVLICGWNARGRTIVEELRVSDGGDRRPIVILGDLPAAPIDAPETVFVRGDPARKEDLARAGLERAATAILPADDTHSSSPHDIDGKTLLTVLSVESEAGLLHVRRGAAGGERRAFPAGERRRADRDRRSYEFAPRERGDRSRRQSDRRRSAHARHRTRARQPSFDRRL